MGTWRLVQSLALVLLAVSTFLGEAHAFPVNYNGRVVDDEDKGIQVWVVAWGNDGIPGVSATLLGYVRSNANGDYWLTIDPEGIIKDRRNIHVTFVSDDGRAHPAMNNPQPANNMGLGKQTFPKEMPKKP